MKPMLLIPLALLPATIALAQATPDEPVVIAEANSSMLVKMTSSVSTTGSKPGDAVTAEVIDPVPLRGARAEGRVDRADHAILSFSFSALQHGGKTYPIQTRMVSITSSKGNEGHDDLGQRVRIEGAGIIAFGVTTALEEGAEVRLTAWKK